MSLIHVQDINKYYNKDKENELHVLKDFSLDVVSREMIAIIGQSGSGKSTLLNILGCVDVVEDGDYLLDGLSIHTLNDRTLSPIRCEKIGFVFQDFALIESESVLENIKTPLYFDKKIKFRKMNALARETLTSIGILDLEKKPVVQLSGGQKQRVAIARAIVNQPLILLADEPTGSLDSKTSEEMMDSFKKLNKDGMTIIIVTHDLSVAQQCDRIVQIVDGKNVENEY